MKTIKTTLFILLSIVLVLMSTTCDLKDLFSQPSVTVTDITVDEDLSNNTRMNITVEITNNDSRGATIHDATYTAVIEGTSTVSDTTSVDVSWAAGETVTLQMPLTMPTDEAAFLLDTLTTEGSLDFSLTGNFSASTSGLGTLTLPLDTTGTAVVIIETDNLFSQPDVTANDFTVTSNPANLLAGSLNLEVNTTITNMDDHTADVTEVIYTVTLENTYVSQEMTYNGSSFNLTPNGTPADNDTRDMPITFPITAAAVAATSPVAYTITGTFFAETDLGSGPIGFWLPLDVSGSATLNPYTP
jgi:hypothetical protein